jgi:MarR family transcriptional repressor of emrRAB
MSNFSAADNRIARISERLPDYPRQHITLHRLGYHIQKRLQDKLNAYLKEFGLSAVSYTALMVLYGSADETQRASELGEACAEKPANMTRICDDLDACGLISRHPSGTDRRGVVITLTAAGRKLMKKITPAYQDIISHAYAGISDTSLKAQEAMLRRQLDNLAS